MSLDMKRLEDDLYVIQKLDDQPNDVGGLTAEELKLKFDEGPNRIKTYINETLIPALSDTVAEAEARAKAEAERISAETARAEAEGRRALEEEKRAAAEAARAEAERSRLGGESARAQAEAERNTAEAARLEAERAREREETARASAEGGRKSAETVRRDAERARVDAEARRIADEAARAAAERAREELAAASEVWEPYDGGKDYVPHNKVRYRGSSYLCRTACRGKAPDGADGCWQLIAERGDDGVLIDERTGRRVRVWFGTVEEYNALAQIRPDTYYNILEGSGNAR